MTTRSLPSTPRPMALALHSLLLAGGLSLAGSALAKPVTWDDIANDHKTTNNVLQYGMGTNAQRWSPLAQVNADNVFKLTPAWSFSFGDEKQRGQESRAIVHDGVIYVSGSYSRVFALDAKTGQCLWTYNHRLPDNIRPCCDVVNRGAAIYGDKIYFDTLDARVVALNKDTGKVVWQHKEKLPLWAGVLATKGNLVFTGTGDGFFKAFDAKTGKELWKFQTGTGVISPPITWEQDGEQYIGVTAGYGGAVPLWGGDMAKLTKPAAQGGSFWIFKLPSWDKTTAKR